MSLIRSFMLFRLFEIIRPYVIANDNILYNSTNPPKWKSVNIFNLDDSQPAFIIK